MLSALTGKQEHDTFRIVAALGEFTDEHVVVLGGLQHGPRVLVVFDDRRHPDVFFAATRQGVRDVGQADFFCPGQFGGQGRT